MRYLKLLGATFVLASVALATPLQPVFVALAGDQGQTGNPTIAFVTYDKDYTMGTINLVNLNGSHVTPLVTNRYLISPVLSPDGTKLAFSASLRGMSQYDLYVVGTDGSNLRKLSSLSSRDLSMVPAWSPDSRQLLYAVALGGYVYRFFKVNADGTGEEELRFQDFRELLAGPWLAWSPDGAHIAVQVVSDTPYGRLYILDADGTHAHPFPGMAPDGDSYERLVWSPDGQRVLLYRLQRGADPTVSIVVADADGSHQRVIARNPPVNISTPSWSPDGNQVVFVANEPVFRAPGDLWVVNSDGSKLHRLHIAENVAPFYGTSWGMIPKAVTPPSKPVSLSGQR